MDLLSKQEIGILLAFPDTLLQSLTMIGHGLYFSYTVCFAFSGFKVFSHGMGMEIQWGWAISLFFLNIVPPAQVHRTLLFLPFPSSPRADCRAAPCIWPTLPAERLRLSQRCKGGEYEVRTLHPVLGQAALIQGWGFHREAEGAERKAGLGQISTNIQWRTTTQSCSHHHYLISEHFHLPKKKPWTH